MDWKTNKTDRYSDQLLGWGSQLVTMTNESHMISYPTFLEWGRRIFSIGLEIKQCLAVRVSQRISKWTFVDATGIYVNCSAKLQYKEAFSILLQWERFKQSWNPLTLLSTFLSASWDLGSHASQIKCLV